MHVTACAARTQIQTPTRARAHTHNGHDDTTCTSRRAQHRTVHRNAGRGSCHACFDRCCGRRPLTCCLFVCLSLCFRFVFFLLSFYICFGLSALLVSPSRAWALQCAASPRCLPRSAQPRPRHGHPTASPPPSDYSHRRRAAAATIQRRRQHDARASDALVAVRPCPSRRVLCSLLVPSAAPCAAHAASQRHPIECAQLRRRARSYCRGAPLLRTQTAVRAAASSRAHGSANTANCAQTPRVYVCVRAQVGTRLCVRASVRVCVRARVRAHACARACVHMRACVRAHACARACVRACTCVRACVHMRACVRACVRACMRACVRACACVALLFARPRRSAAYSEYSRATCNRMSGLRSRLPRGSTSTLWRTVPAGF
jgi:hypothetical protein